MLAFLNVQLFRFLQTELVLLLRTDHKVLDRGVLLEHDHLIPHFAGRNFQLLEVVLYCKLVVILGEDLQSLGYFELHKRLLLHIVQVVEVLS